MERSWQDEGEEMVPRCNSSPNGEGSALLSGEKWMWINESVCCHGNCHILVHYLETVISAPVVVRSEMMYLSDTKCQNAIKFNIFHYIHKKLKHMLYDIYANS